MNDIQYRSFNGLRAGGTAEFLALGAEQLSSLASLPPDEPASVLGGRRSVSYISLPPLGRVVVKYYTRGGLFGLLVSHRYLKLGSVRSELEYKMLETVRKLGVSAPEPIGFLWSGGLFYRTWLVTREIEKRSTLAELALKDEELARAAVDALVKQVNILLEHGIFHVDLHPGNVLVDQQGQVFLVDFDKAAHFGGKRGALRDRYIFRWRRAVIKHRLPDILSEMVCLGLKRAVV